MFGGARAARTFIATGERIYREHRSDAAFDFAPVRRCGGGIRGWNVGGAANEGAPATPGRHARSPGRIRSPLRVLIRIAECANARAR
jgi:hypothetical protein